MKAKLLLILGRFLIFMIFNSQWVFGLNENPCSLTDEGDVDDKSYCYARLFIGENCWSAKQCSLPPLGTCTVGQFYGIKYCSVQGWGMCIKEADPNYCRFGWLDGGGRCIWTNYFINYNNYCYNDEGEGGGCGGQNVNSVCSGDTRIKIPYIKDNWLFCDETLFEEFDCLQGTFCSGGRCVACNECILNSQRCSGTQIQTCESYGNGCTRWSTPTDCQSGQQCYGNSCQSCVACNSGTKQCSGTQIEQLCTSYGNQCTRWTSTACGFGEQCQNGQCQQVTAGLCSQYNTWKQFLRNETGGHNACANPYTNCTLTKIGSNNLFDHYCSSGNTIPIYRTMNISQKINLGGNLKEKFTVFLEK